MLTPRTLNLFDIFNSDTKPTLDCWNERYGVQVGDDEEEEVVVEGHRDQFKFIDPRLTYGTIGGRFKKGENPFVDCGKLMNIEIFLSNKKAVDKDSVDGVFVKGIVFMVTDDLQIMPIGTETCFTHLKSLDIEGRDLLDEHVVHVGVDEIVCMLRNLFLSKMPLTEVLLSNHASDTPPALKFMSNNITESKAKYKDIVSAETTNIVLKFTISKEKNKIMYSEPGKGFVAFLFSLLAFPLGSVVKLLDQTPSLGCLSNL
ncbi:hypothetical protein GIB67_022219 [Kingdonia uniflora]|uniref:Uncharacterized protein n=1 Tax=Kingdonia uniflora TaxID=39325 RepID=A0A7J7M6V2_9MAGN|nr:hypothetical protein GIB67_022219 [Kingdonia uniflora]